MWGPFFGFNMAGLFRRHHQEMSDSGPTSLPLLRVQVDCQS
jgi:hypothetical protein